jgi:hypothetical protein
MGKSSLDDLPIDSPSTPADACQKVDTLCEGQAQEVGVSSKWIKQLQEIA